MSEPNQKIYFKTPNGEIFFQYVQGESGGENRVKVVDLSRNAVELLRYEAGMFWAWGCAPATEAEFSQALELALEGLNAQPKPGKQLPIF